jgi:hypothetical protein
VTDGTLPVTHSNTGRPAKSSRLVRAYLWSRVFKARISRLIESLFTGFWLAILSPSDLDSVDDEYYLGVSGKRTSPIDYANTAYNKRGLFEWERSAFEEYFPAGASIGLMAAGGGREVLALRNMSFEVEAWECQPHLIDAANELLVAEGFEPSVTYAPRNAVIAGTKIYDALVIGWSTYTLIPGRSRRITLLRELRTKVKAGSPMLLSFFARRPGGVQFRIMAGLGNVGRRLLGRERLEEGDALEPNFAHWFLEEEIASELAEGGFELKFFSATPYGHAIALATGPDGRPASGGDGSSGGAVGVG